MTSELDEMTRLYADISELNFLVMQQTTVLRRLEDDAVVARRQRDLYDRQLDRLLAMREQNKEAAASLATSGRLTHREDTSNEQHEDY